MKSLISGLFVATLALALAACSSHSSKPREVVPFVPEISPEEQFMAGEPVKGWTYWICENSTEIYWRALDDQYSMLDVRLGGSDIVNRLTRQESADGSLYSDGRLSFQTKGNEGSLSWTSTERVIGSGCRAPAPR